MMSADQLIDRRESLFIFATSRAIETEVHLAYREVDGRCEVGRLNSLAKRALKQYIRLIDPMDRFYQMAIRAAEDVATRRKERGLWYYRRTTGISNRASIRKSVNRELERLLPQKFDPKSFVRRLHAVLIKRNKYGIAKVHSPPRRLFPKTLHPIDSVA